MSSDEAPAAGWAVVAEGGVWGRRALAVVAGVQVIAHGSLRPANGRDFRYGAAVHQVRQGVPLSEVQQQLGYARIDSTSVYAKLANPERRAIADRVEW